MLDTTKPLISFDKLKIYDEEIKNYIKALGAGVTLDDVQQLIDESKVTYELTKENQTIILSGSDGTSTEVNDSDSQSTNEVLSATQPTDQKEGDTWLKTV